MSELQDLLYGAYRSDRPTPDNPDNSIMDAINEAMLQRVVRREYLKKRGELGEEERTGEMPTLEQLVAKYSDQIAEDPRDAFGNITPTEDKEPEMQDVGGPLFNPFGLFGN